MDGERWGLRGGSFGWFYEGLAGLGAGEVGGFDGVRERAKCVRGTSKVGSYSFLGG